VGELLRGGQVDDACTRLNQALDNCTARQACVHSSGLHGALGLALHAQLCALLAASATGQESGAEAREEAEEEEEDSRDDRRGNLYSQRRSESDEDGEEEEWTGGRLAARRPAKRPLMGGGSSGAADNAAAAPTHDLAQGAEPMLYELPPELWAETAEAAVVDDEDDEGGASSYTRPNGGRGAAQLSGTTVTDKARTLTASAPSAPSAPSALSARSALRAPCTLCNPSLQMLKIVDEACRHLVRALEQQPEATVYESCLVQLRAFQGKQVDAGRRLAHVAINVAPSVATAELRLHWLQRHQPREVAARSAAAAKLLEHDPASPRGAAELHWQLRTATATATATTATATTATATAAAAAAAATPATAAAARRKTLESALELAAGHVEVRRADPRAWRLLADTLTALADSPPSDGGGGGPCARWWAGVRDWWVEACFHDAEAPISGSAEELRRERARTARALQAALGAGDDDAELAAVAGVV